MKQDPYARTNNICLVFIALCMAIGALVYMRPVLIPLIFSVFTYSVLTPIVAWLKRKTKMPKGLAVIVSLAIFAVLLALTVSVLSASVQDFIDGAPKYKQSLTQSMDYIEGQLLAFNINLELESVKNIIRSTSFQSAAQKVGSQLLSFLGNLFLVFIFTIFMMSGESRSQKKGPLLKEILAKVSSYISAKFFLSMATGFCVWVVLLFYGVELASIFALLAVLFNFIPTIGSILAWILPLPIVFLQYQFSVDFFVILALTGAPQIIIGNIIEPKVMGDSMDLHPVTVLVCLVFWGMVWGVAGMFLAVPVTAILKIIFSKVEATRDFSEILAGRLPT